MQAVAHRTQVLVLQHPLEATHPKGTARLLHQCLPHSRMLLGESWPTAGLNDWLHDPWPADATHAALPAPALTLLLYPPFAPDPALPLQAPPAWDMADLARLPADASVRLVVLDGTWRKSRKMLFANPGLQQLPRLPLHELPESRYAIRKAHKPGQLSTLEATWAALRQLEFPPSHGDSEPDTLLHAMDALQANYRRSLPT